MSPTRTLGVSHLRPCTYSRETPTSADDVGTPPFTPGPKYPGTVDSVSPECSRKARLGLHCSQRRSAVGIDNRQRPWNITINTRAASVKCHFDTLGSSSGGRRTLHTRTRGHKAGEPSTPPRPCKPVVHPGEEGASQNTSRTP